MSNQPMRRQPFSVARLSTLVGLALIGISLLLTGDLFYRATFADDNTEALTRAAGELQIRIRDAIQIRLQAVEALHAFMLAGDTLPDAKAFDRFAGNMLHHYPEIRALQYVDTDRTIRQIYPLEGNEAALNLDLSNHPATPLVEKAIAEQITTLAAPSILAQGSLSAVARTPLVYGDTFLGLVQGVFDVSAILEDALATKTLGLPSNCVTKLVRYSGMSRGWLARH